MTKKTTKNSEIYRGRSEARKPTVVEVVVIPTDGCAGIGPLSQVMTRLTGSTLVTATPSAALTGGVAPLTAPPVAPESPGTLRYTHPIGQTRTKAHRGQEA